MLDVQNVAVNYRSGNGLDPISFRVAPGQLVGVMGPNGAGKSTMMKAMVGLVPKMSGQVSYCTCPLHQQLEKVAYVPQRSQIDWYYPITVQNVVMMSRTRSLGWFRSPTQQSRKIVRAAMERVEIWDLKNRRIGQLSGGQQQRVFLARALAQQAEILLFDEPFTGVDGTTEEILFRVFQELRSDGKILMVSSHDWGNALGQLDRMLLLNKGLIADGTPAEVLTQANLSRAYGRVWNQVDAHSHSIEELAC